MEKVLLHLPDGDVEYGVVVDEYKNGGTAVALTDADGEWDIILSVWLPETVNLPKNAFYVKHWTENEEVVKAMLDQKLLVKCNAPVASSGFIQKISAYTLA